MLRDAAGMRTTVCDTGGVKQTFGKQGNMDGVLRGNHNLLFDVSTVNNWTDPRFSITTLSVVAYAVAATWRDATWLPS